MKDAVIYIHGKGGSAEESSHYQPLFPDCAVIGFDYTARTPWEAGREFPVFFDSAARKYKSVSIVANSIGAYFAMDSLWDRRIQEAFFISPIVNMETLICDMMRWENVTEQELRAKSEIVTSSGETLSWAYLSYVREHPVRWPIPTHILYGAKDTLTSHDTITGFADRIGASLTVMEDGSTGSTQRNKRPFWTAGFPGFGKNGRDSLWSYKIFHFWFFS